MIVRDPVNGHVTQEGFGSKPDLFEQVIDKCAQIGPLSNPWEIPYFLTSIYDSIFQLSQSAFIVDVDGEYKHKTFDNRTAPLRMITMTAQEGLLETFGWKQRLFEHQYYEIYKTYGLSLTEWLNYPPFIVEEMLRTLKHAKKRREEEQSKALKDLDSIERNNIVDNFVNNSSML